MQYWSQVPSPVVLMPVVIVVVIDVVMVALASLAPEVEVDSSALSLLVASLLDDALLASPPLDAGSLLAVSPSLDALVLALVVIVVPTVTDVPNVGSSRMSAEQAIDESAKAMPSRDDVPTISRASQTSSALDLEIPRVEERPQ